MRTVVIGEPIDINEEVVHISYKPYVDRVIDLFKTALRMRPDRIIMNGTFYFTDDYDQFLSYNLKSKIVHAKNNTYREFLLR